MTSRSKKDICAFDFTDKNLSQLIKKGINNEGDYVFPDLGSRLSFYSSKNVNESAGIRIHVGTSHRQFKNTFIVDLPLSLEIYGSKRIQIRLLNLFKEVIEIINPYWGCISNRRNTAEFDGYWKLQKPTTIHWLNFFDSETINSIGRTKLNNCSVNKIEKFNEGKLIILDENPINIEDSESLILQNKVNVELGLYDKQK